MSEKKVPHLKPVSLPDLESYNINFDSSELYGKNLYWFHRSHDVSLGNLFGILFLSH